MGAVKRIVCLANSRKLAGRCVAGKEWAGEEVGGWIRPVSARDSGELSEYERQYQGGSDPDLLDIIDVPVISAQPCSYQAENWLLDTGFFWRRIGTVEWNQLASLADAPSSLWNNASSTRSGRNDRVLESIANTFGSSLYLLYATDLSLHVFAPGIEFGEGSRRVQGRFRYRAMEYWLRVTDPVWERSHLAKANGDYPIGECYLTVSLGEPYEGYCYKLIAAIITPPGPGM